MSRRLPTRILSHPRYKPFHPRYKIVRKLGTGGTSSVYLARDLLEDSREVALKVCQLEIAPEQLLREFRILRELRHPGIARAFDFGRLPRDGAAYFTLEYVGGINLEKQSAALRRQVREDSPGPLLDLFLQTTSALAYFHKKGLLHLDLKPANVVIFNGRAKLIDFGLFQNANFQGSCPPRGSAFFTSPEVLDGGPIDRRADLYSLGATLYKCFTGRYPITGRTLAEIADNHRQMLPKPPSGLPRGLSRIILKLLAKSPQHRFQGAEEVEEALKDLMKGRPSASSSGVAGELDFVGRKQELDVFFTWFSALEKTGKESVLLVEGEPGIGKSRLADAATTEMLGLGTQVVPLKSFGGKDRDGLRLLVDKALILRPLTKQERSRHRFLFTVLGITADHLSRKEISELPLEQIRARVFESALELFARSTPPPLVMVIEDLHRADPQLRAFVRWLADAESLTRRDARVGVLATSSKPPGTPREDKSSKPPTLQLGPLSRNQLLELLRHWKPPLGPREIARLAGLARGNPGRLLLELERARTGSPAKATSTAWSKFRRDRIRGLDGSVHLLFLYLGLLERPADERLLRGLTGSSPSAFRDARLGLERTGVLKGSSRGYYLDQNMLGDSWQEDFSRDLVHKAHERIGRSILRDPGRLWEAAYHLLRGGLLEEGLRAAERAGMELRAAGRVEEALAIYSEALEHGPPSSVERRFLEQIGELQEKSGQFDQAARFYQRFLDLPALSATDRLRVLRKLGGIQARIGDYEAASQTFERGLQLLDSADAVEEHLYLFQELSALYLFRGDFPRAANFANRGLELLSSADASKLSGEAHAHHALDFHSAAGHILLRQFEYDRAAREFLSGLKFAERVGSLSNAALILNNLGIAYHQSNRLREALKVYQRATSIARRMGDSTALFSIQVNVATIRARLGQLGAAEELFQEIERMPHAERSKRAHLNLLYSRGLVERLALTETKDLWEECIRLADELPDPIFASYGRVWLLENEIHQGRWAPARKLLQELGKIKGKDARLDRSVTLRQAYLEALTGQREKARALLAGMERPQPGAASPSYADLWDDVYAAAALLERGDLKEAEDLLERTRRVFDESRQAPGSLECSLLLADLSLRARDSFKARKRLNQTRRTLSLHDAATASRMAPVRLPYLEARGRLEDRPADKTYVADRIVDAAGNLRPGSTAEIAWLLDLVAGEQGEAGTRRKAAAALRQFVAGLTPEDRKSYLARDHRARLGLGPTGARPVAALSSQEGAMIRRYETLLRLRQSSSPREALQAILDAAGAERGAIFLEGDARVLALCGLKAMDKRRLEDLRALALRVGSGKAASGLCAEVRPPGRPRMGVLYVESAADPVDGQLAGFLETAGQLLGPVLAASPGRSKQLLTLTRQALKKAIATQTLSPSSYDQSESPRLRELMAMVHRTRDSRLPILITGESGAGKDHLARWIHSLSPRSKGPFVAQDCTAIPEGLVEADIFGYEAGAFTGAQKAKTGFIFAATGGTYYLDNVDCLSLDVQAKLLRVLGEGMVRPVGGRTPQKTDVRVMASSQRDLKDLAARGGFRKDLYFRLAGICLDIPPLRERAEDIPRLIRQLQRQIPGRGLSFTPSAMELLKTYSWPGNVRELESMLRRLALTSEGAVDKTRVAQILGLDGAPPVFPRWVFEGRSYERLVEDVKREYLLHLFERFGGDIDRIAKELGTTKRNVYLRFSQAGIRPVDLR
jgi:DNA-binding NtrC family response regulator/tetratricopeptide (TPR) repeat protein